MKGIHDRLISRAVKDHIPITGAIELLPLCNFKCGMCYVRKNDAEVRQCGGLQNVDFWLDLAGQLRDLGCVFPLITGGEPFLYPGLKELLGAMHHMGMQVSINTNGSLLDEKAIDWLVETPPARINITLYGASRDTYGKLCGNPDAFDKVLHAADLLKGAGLPFRFNCSLTPDNAEDVEAMMKISSGYGIGLRISSYMMPPLRSQGTIGDYEGRLTPDEAAYYEAKISYEEAPPQQFRAIAHNNMMYREPTKQQLCEAENGPAGKMRCMAGRCSFWVDWEGNLSPCGLYTIPKISLEEQSFAQAWDSIVKHTAAFEFSPACENCINRKLCPLCAAAVYNETGDWNGRPTYLCEKLRSLAKWYEYFLEKMPDGGGELLEVDYKPECVFDELQI